MLILRWAVEGGGPRRLAPVGGVPGDTPNDKGAETERSPLVCIVETGVPWFSGDCWVSVCGGCTDGALKLSSGRGESVPWLTESAMLGGG